MHTRQQSHAHSPPDRLCNFPLIYSAQAGLPSVFYPAHGRHVFGHHGEILIVTTGSVHQRWENRPFISSRVRIFKTQIR